MTGQECLNTFPKKIKLAIMTDMAIIGDKRSLKKKYKKPSEFVMDMFGWGSGKVDGCFYNKLHDKLEDSGQ